MPLRVMLAALMILAVTAAVAAPCEDCHQEVTPQIVSDWRLSGHSRSDVGCAACHGERHRSRKDASRAGLPTPARCGACHEAQVTQFERGKHANAWAAMKAMPTFHWQPSELTEGMKGCGGCHKIGIKSEQEIRELKSEGSGFGVASCDSCHTRHLFSAEEARQPQACQTCHMGFGHPQWEIYSSSKHGVRYLLKQAASLPRTAAAPTCQTCHMSEGSHEVRTAWGFLAVRLPMPEDQAWKADRITILQGLGVLDRDQNPTPRLELVRQADVARLTETDWQRERDRMVRTCGQCHSRNFARAELGKGDEIVRKADGVMAKAIRIVAGLYQDGILEPLSGYPNSDFDLLTFHDAATPIENRLFVMFLKHRMRAFQGAFHSNPDYTLWYGWSEMRQDLTEIQAMASELRRRHAESGS